MRNKEKKIKNETKKEKRLPRFHFLDAIIILLVIAVCVGVFFRQNIFDLFGSFKNLTVTEVSFSVKNVDKNIILDNIDIGDTVYFDSDGSNFGTIMLNSDSAEFALSYFPAYEVFFEDGEYKTVYYPEEAQRVNAEGKIECKGIFAEDGSFMLNGSTYLAPGQTVVICTEEVTLEIVITDIEAS